MRTFVRRGLRDPRTRAAVVAVLLSVGVAFLDTGGDLDLTRFLRVGEKASAREFVEADLPDTHIAPGWGHDGQANYVLSRVFPDLPAADGVLDSVTYRARRIGYPALVSWVPSGMATVIALWVVNLAAIGAAAAAVAHLARSRGASWLAGAAVGITPAFLTSMIVDLGDSLAFALGAWGLIAWRHDRTATRAIILFTLAALTRETTLVIPLAAFVAGIGTTRRAVSLSPLMIPALVVAAWIGWLEIWIGDPGKSATQFRAPFLGWQEQGFASPEIMVAAALTLGSLWVAQRLWSIDRTLSFVLLFDAAILVLVDRDVLFNPLNLSRVTPWVIPLGVLAVTIGATSSDEDGLRREADPVVEGLVNGTSARHR